MSELTIDFDVLLTKSSYSMYEVAKIWTIVRGKVVREQMMYNYRKNHLIKVGPDGRSSRDQVIEFLTKKIK